MKIKLKFIYGKDNILKIKILFMDERFRVGFGKSWNRFRASNNFEIYSFTEPELGTEHLCLWGKYKNFDNKIAERHFSPEEIKPQINKIKKALKEWSQNWTGFNESGI